jgi:hypothetical protein
MPAKYHDWFTYTANKHSQDPPFDAFTYEHSKLCYT